MCIRVEPHSSRHCRKQFNQASFSLGCKHAGCKSAALCQTNMHKVTPCIASFECAYLHDDATELQAESRCAKALCTTK
eukprot:2676272-Pleurochrysis_carterae.AAC.1